MKNNAIISTILIADLHPIVKLGLEQIIRQHWPEYQVVYYNNFQEAYAYLAEKPQLFILDLNIEGENKLSTFTQVMSKHKDINVLIYTGFNEKMYALPYLRAGARGFISKSATEAEIVKAIAATLKGEKHLSAEVKELLMESFLGGKLDDYNLSSLSTRELQVAELLVNGMGVLDISNKLSLQMGTVSTYKLRIFSKLKVTNIIQLAEKMSVISS